MRHLALSLTSFSARGSPPGPWQRHQSGGQLREKARACSRPDSRAGVFAPVCLPTYLTAYARPSEGYIRVKSPMDALGHCPVRHISVLQGPLSCQVAVTVARPGGYWVTACSLEPGGGPQFCITELWSLGSQRLRGGGGVADSRRQTPAPPTASILANFNLQLPKFSGSHSKRYEVAFCNVSIASTYQEDLHPQGALEPRRLLLPELSQGQSNRQASRTGFVVFRELPFSGLLCDSSRFPPW